MVATNKDGTPATAEFWKKAATKIVILLCLAACARIPGIKAPPALRTELTSVPEYEQRYDKRYEEYKKGYKDGCETGFSANSLPFYKSFNTWIQDPYLANKRDHIYLTSWKDAYAFCAMFGSMMRRHGLGNFR